MWSILSPCILEVGSRDFVNQESFYCLNAILSLSHTHTHVIHAHAAGMKGNASGSFALHSLWFKFNEGFSNAVRRPVHMKDLL